MELGVSFRIAWQHGGFGFMDVGQTFGLLGKPFGSLACLMHAWALPSLPFPRYFPSMAAFRAALVGLPPPLVSRVSCLGSAVVLEVIEERGFPYPGG